MTDDKVKAERLLELIELFDGASKMCTNIIDPPFDCVPLNIRPSTCVEIASILASQAALQAERDKLSAEIVQVNAERFHWKGVAAQRNLLLAEEVAAKDAAEAKLTALVEPSEVVFAEHKARYSILVGSAWDRLGQALAAPSPSLIQPQPVAWLYELANHRHADGTYTDWSKPDVSLREPCVPEGAIRNLTPLYALPSVGHPYPAPGEERS